MNKKRLEIWNKSGGKCWYCGCELGEKGWHIDHFHPVVRGVLGDSSKMTYPELDTIDNLVPSCAPCNNFKHSMSIEGYRSMCKEQFINIPKYTTGARQLERLGLLDFAPKEVEFWYEKAGIKMKSEDEMIGLLPEANDVEWRKEETEQDCYHAVFDKFICTMRYADGFWLLIATTFNFERLAEHSIPNGHRKFKIAADWALRLEKA